MGDLLEARVAGAVVVAARLAAPTGVVARAEAALGLDLLARAADLGPAVLAKVRPDGLAGVAGQQLVLAAEACEVSDHAVDGARIGLIFVGDEIADGCVHALTSGCQSRHLQTLRPPGRTPYWQASRQGCWAAP